MTMFRNMHCSHGPSSDFNVSYTKPKVTVLDNVFVSFHPVFDRRPDQHLLIGRQLVWPLSVRFAFTFCPVLGYFIWVRTVIIAIYNNPFPFILYKIINTR